jgi:hypothetical protein
LGNPFCPKGGNDSTQLSGLEILRNSRYGKESSTKLWFSARILDEKIENCVSNPLKINLPWEIDPHTTPLDKLDIITQNCVCICMHMHTCICMHMFVRKMHIHAYAYLHMHAYACMCMHMHACAPNGKIPHADISIYIYIYIYNAAGIEQKHIDIYNAAGIEQKHIDIYNAAGIEQKHIDIYNAAGIELAKGEPAEGPVGILVSGRLVVETYICWLVVKIQKPRFLRSFKIILGTFGPRAIFLKITLWPFGPRAIFLELSWGPLGTGPCFDL